jgi:hypothetical protein
MAEQSRYQEGRKKIKVLYWRWREARVNVLLEQQMEKRK